MPAGAMSGAEGWSRRAALAAGMAAAVAPVRALAGVRSAPVRAKAITGIRYARAERFRPPVPVDGIDQDSHAFVPGLGAFGPSCPQPGTRYQPQSEDCLFLNVWTTAERSGPGRPVMVYIHGGAYSNGSVNDELTDGSLLAEQGDVVVVTVNHRLNALGYLYLPDRFPDSGNAGQLDLICALEWVRDHIATFGGDPGNVTLFGQSGGGAKIATLMAMPAARGLFHKAITMSGQQITASGPLHARQRAEALLAELGGADPAQVPVARLIAALSARDPVMGGALYMGPVLDMRALPRHPFWPDAARQSLGIPLLLGNCVAESRAFFPPDHPRLQGLDWDNLAARTGPEMKVDIDPDWVVARFRERYPAANPAELFHRIVTAARSWRGQVEEAEARARAGAPAFVYQLDFEAAKHTDDIGLAFGTSAGASPARAAMSATLMAAFVRFARTGDPGWPAYELARRETMVFDTASQVVSNPRGWERELFARVPYIQPGS